MVRACLAAAVILLLLIGCSGSEKKTGPGAKHRGFYYWQADASNFDWDNPAYRALGVDRLYVRLFDVDWSDEAGAAVPVGATNFYYASMDDIPEIIPVVFITNETFLHLDSVGVKQLARNIHRKMLAGLHMLWNSSTVEARMFDFPETGPYRQKSKRLRDLHERDSIYTARWASIKEIQFDCDWTKSTHDNYFTFLRECRKVFEGKQLSSTIRLYPYKYARKAGVPPVDRGMLMCYNAGDVRNIKTSNSIFDRAEIMSYLKSAEKYPLPLDYALPVFEWAVLYRDSVFKTILPVKSLHDNYERFISNQPGGYAVVDRDFVLGYTAQSLYLRKGDIIRYEQPSITDVGEVAGWLSEYKNNEEATLTFYHLNNDDLQYAAKLEEMYRSF